MGKSENFEREQCRVLSLWWTDGERDDIFWRRRTRRTGKSKDIRYQLGDIIAEDAVGAPLFETFNVELKSGYSKTRSGKRTKNIPWDLLDVIDYSEGLAQNKQRQIPVILGFWEQTKRDAKLSGRVPLLIFHRDYHVPVVCVDQSFIMLFEPYLGSLPREVPVLRLDILDLGVGLILIRGQEFFRWLRPEGVRVIHSRVKGVLSKV